MGADHPRLRRPQQAAQLCPRHQEPASGLCGPMGFHSAPPKGGRWEGAAAMEASAGTGKGRVGWGQASEAAVQTGAGPDGPRGPEPRRRALRLWELRSIKGKGKRPYCHAL